MILEQVQMMRMCSNNKTKTRLCRQHPFCFDLQQKTAEKYIRNYDFAPLTVAV